MNPVTNGLLKALGNPQFKTFSEDWDRLESLVVEIYKQKSVSFAQQEEYFELRQRLVGTYAQLSPELARFWPRTKVKGAPVTGDPFLAVIDKLSAKEFLENWDVMKTLPAAREAFNQMLMEKIEAKS